MRNNEELIPRAEEVYQLLADGDYGSIRAQMTLLVRRMLHEEKVMGVWQRTVDTVGALASLGESFVRPSGSNVVVETPLVFDAGELVGRIAYNRRGKIVGMLILPPDAVANGPF